MKLLVINGPNLNFVGIREPQIYGSRTYKDLVASIEGWADELELKVDVYQSNHEGEIVTRIQDAYFEHVDGIVINAAAYTHTSVAILDALKSVSIPAVEVHISNVDAREAFRQISYPGMYCEKTIKGHGLEGYREAILYLKEKYA